MKLISQHPRPVSAPPRRAAFPVLRWVRRRSGVEKALLLKAFFTLVVAGIAIFAVSVMAHTLQNLTDSISK